MKRFISSFRSSNQRPQIRTRTLARPGLETLESRCLLAAGALDATFGAGGIAVAALSGNQQGNDVAVYPTGTAHAGKTIVSGGSGGDPQFLLLRHNANGSLDTSFGSGGVVTTNFERQNQREYSTAVAIQPDGRIVSGGIVWERLPSHNYYAGLARYNANGSLDKTFGSGGKVTIGSFGVVDMLVQPDGKIVAVGGGKIVRLLTNGKLDTSFDGDGIATFPANHSKAVALQSDGKLVVAGETTSWTRPDNPLTAENESRVFETSALWRFNSNGSLDGSFGTSGQFVLNLNDANQDGQVEDDDRAMAVAVQTSGKIVALIESQADRVITIRLNPSGTLDATYGTSGISVTTAATIAPGKEHVQVYATDVGNGSLSLQPDGKPVVAVGGFYSVLINPEEPDPALWEFEVTDISVVLRYTADGALDPTWAGTGVTSLNENVHMGNHVAVQPDGRVVMMGQNAAFTDVVLARYLGDSPVQAAGGVVRPANNLNSLTPGEIELIRAEAIARWQAAEADTSSLAGAEIRTADLSVAYLAMTDGQVITLDSNAAGWGWFVDLTPGNDDEFGLLGNQGEQQRMDLLTVVIHEMGHLLGHDHDEDGVMAETLAAGVRRTGLEHDDVADVDRQFDESSDQHHFAWLGAWLNEQFDLNYGRARRRR